jgi:preprotein translocase subunit SecG
MSRFGTEFNSSRKRRQSSFLFEMMTICVTLFVVSMVLLDFTLVQAANQAAGFAAVSEPSSQQFLLPNNGHLRARRSLASGRWGLRPGILKQQQQLFLARIKSILVNLFFSRQTLLLGRRLRIVGPNGGRWSSFVVDFVARDWRKWFSFTATAEPEQ